MFISMCPKYIYRQKEQDEELSYIATSVFTTSNYFGGGGGGVGLQSKSYSYFALFVQLSDKNGNFFYYVWIFTTYYK